MSASPKGSTRFRQERRSRRRQGAATQIKGTSIFRSGLTRIAPNISENSPRWENVRPKRLTVDIHPSRRQTTSRTTSQPNLSYPGQTLKLSSKVATTRLATKRPAKLQKIQIMLTRPALRNLNFLINWNPHLQIQTKLEKSSPLTSRWTRLLGLNRVTFSRLTRKRRRSK